MRSYTTARRSSRSKWRSATRRRRLRSTSSPRSSATKRSRWRPTRCCPLRRRTSRESTGLAGDITELADLCKSAKRRATPTWRAALRSPTAVRPPIESRATTRIRAAAAGTSDPVHPGVGESSVLRRDRDGVSRRGAPMVLEPFSFGGQGPLAVESGAIDVTLAPGTSTLVSLGVLHATSRRDVDGGSRTSGVRNRRALVSLTVARRYARRGRQTTPEIATPSGTNIIATRIGT